MVFDIKEAKSLIEISSSLPTLSQHLNLSKIAPMTAPSSAAHQLTHEQPSNPLHSTTSRSIRFCLHSLCLSGCVPYFLPSPFSLPLSCYEEVFADWHVITNWIKVPEYAGSKYFQLGPVDLYRWEWLLVAAVAKNLDAQG